MLPGERDQSLAAEEFHEMNKEPLTGARMSGYVGKHLLERIDNCNAVLNDFSIGARIWECGVARRWTHHFTKGWIARQRSAKGSLFLGNTEPWPCSKKHKRHTENRVGRA